MYKWHAHSTIGRGRPIANDLARVMDGIAASLRQFSLSVQRCAEKNDADRSPQQSRSQRSASAVKEVSALAPRKPSPPKGIDARSLAAKPPGQRFTIRRYDPNDKFGSSRILSPSQGRPFNPRIGASSRGGPASRGAGRGGRGGAARGGNPGLRGRNARRPRDRKPKHADQEDFEVPPYTEAEELEYNSITGGLEADYNPTTSLESLRGWGPAVITSAQGFRENIVKKLETSIDKKGAGFRDSAWHKETVANHKMTILKTEEKEMYGGESGEELASWSKPMDEATRQELNKEWVAGHYEKPGVADKDDILGLVRSYARKNQGYLAEDARQFESQVAALLPASLQKGSAKAEKRV